MVFFPLRIQLYNSQLRVYIPQFWEKSELRKKMTELGLNFSEFQVFLTILRKKEKKKELSLYHAVLKGKKGFSLLFFFDYD